MDMDLKKGDKVKVSPDITGDNNWIDAVVFDIKNNSFNGIVVYARTVGGIIYFDKEKYFKKA